MVILTTFSGFFIGAISAIFIYPLLPDKFQGPPNMFFLTLSLCLAGAIIGALLGNYLNDRRG